MARRGAVGAATLTWLAGALCVMACGKTDPVSGSTPAAVPTASIALAAVNPITVSPLPGTPDASPVTQISFLGPPGTSVGDVRVVGSQSGSHPGVLRAYSTGTGESFLPSRPFRGGERVRVSAAVLAGPSAGHRVRTTFTVAIQAPIAQKQFPNNAGDAHAVQHYATAPSLTPSTVTITKPAAPGTSPGYLMMAPYQGTGTPGPMIVDQQGQLVWFDPLPAGMSATNLSVQTYEGRPVLEWWQGRILELGFGQGEDVIYDSSYREIAHVRAGNGYMADLHVTRMTPEGTAWVDAYDPVRTSTLPGGGVAAGVLSDSVIQEIDIRTGLVMWEWHALGHIAMSESKNPAPRNAYPWDYVHINAIDPGTAGDVLVSFRNTWSIDDLDIHSGGFRWQIGGPRSTFKLERGVQFYWQHDAAWQTGGTVSLFDNGSDPPKEKQSRGLLLSLDFAHRAVHLVKQLINPDRTLLAESQGSTQSLPGGNWLLGYGRLPDFTEFDAAGNVLLDGTLGRNVQNFSTSLAPWSAQPPGSPSAVVSGSGVAVSWNGATEVASWRLLAGSTPATLAPVANAARSGFQTELPLPSGAAFVAVQALAADGRVLGVSATIPG